MRPFGLGLGHTPSDSLIHYFSDVLRSRFGYGSAYLVFHKESPLQHSRPTLGGLLEVTDFVGDSDLEKEALR